MMSITGRGIKVNTNTKVIYEFYYVVGHANFHSHYELIVERETEKMLYGDALNNEGNAYGRFAIKKSNLNEVQKIIDRKYGTVYKVQIEENEKETARLKAKDIVYNYLFQVAERFKNYKRED